GGGGVPIDTSKLEAGQQYQLALQQLQNQDPRNRYAIGYDEQSSVEPDVRVTSEFDLSQQGAISAAGQIMGEVSVNFKSDVFPREKLADTDQIQNLPQAQGSGRGSPPPPAPGAKPAAAAATATATAPPPSGGTPAPSPQK